MVLDDYKPLSIDVHMQSAGWLKDTYKLPPEAITHATGEDIKIDMKWRLLKPNTNRQRLYAFEYLAASLGIMNPDDSPINVKKSPRGKPNRIYLSISEAMDHHIPGYFLNDAITRVQAACYRISKVRIW